MIKTSNIYNRAFNKVLRGRASVADTPDLVEGYVDRVGSYYLPTGFDGSFEDQITEANPFRKYGTVVKTFSSDSTIKAIDPKVYAEFLPDGKNIPWSDDVSRDMYVYSYRIASAMKMSSEIAKDLKFDIGKYLYREWAGAFASAEENLFINGSGKSEPMGILTSSETGVTAEALTYDDVVGLFFSLKPQYRKRAVWIMNDKTAHVLRKIKDSNGNYLWNHSDNTILGRPVEYSEFMPDAESGDKPIAFGDLSYYWVLERQSAMVKVLSEMFIHEGNLGYIINERVDGKLIRPEAVKTLEIK